MPLTAPDGVFVVGDDRNPTLLRAQTLSETGFTERHLQDWVSARPDLIGADLLLLAEEFSGWQYGGDPVRDRLDLLFLDAEGALVVCELKRDVAYDTTELQALKYAAYCATLKTDDVVQIHARLHHGDEDAARAAILDHAEGLADGGQPTDVRIRIVAGGFSPAVTSTVMFLSERGIDVACIEVSARALDEKVVLTSRQTVPPPATVDYNVRIRAKREAEQSAERSRRANGVSRLISAGALSPGTVLRLQLGELTGWQRQVVEPWLRDDPARGEAEWAGESSTRALRWRHDGKLYSASGLGRAIMAAAGQPTDAALHGSSLWETETGESLWTLAERLGG